MTLLADHAGLSAAQVPPVTPWTCAVCAFPTYPWTRLARVAYGRARRDLGPRPAELLGDWIVAGLATHLAELHDDVVVAA